MKKTIKISLFGLLTAAQLQAISLINDEGKINIDKPSSNTVSSTLSQKDNTPSSFPRKVAKFSFAVTSLIPVAILGNYIINEYDRNKSVSGNAFDGGMWISAAMLTTLIPYYFWTKLPTAK